jgi:hypothetical protein
VVPLLSTTQLISSTTLFLWDTMVLDTPASLKARPRCVHFRSITVKSATVSLSRCASRLDLSHSIVAESKEHGFKLLFAEAQTAAGPILEIGNTNSRYRFSIGARNFVNRWNQQAPAHHCAVGVGHIGGKLEKLALLLGIEAVRIC